MRLKSYFAATVEQAMRNARRELGDDAMLVNSHRAMPEASHLGNYEVVFAIDEETLSRRESSTAKCGSAPAPDAGVLASQIEQLRQDVSRLALLLDGMRQPGGPKPTLDHALDPWSEEVYSELVQAGIEPETAHQIAARLDSREVAGDPDHTARCLRQELASHFAASPLRARPGVIALVGPAGAGKTLLAEKISASLARNGHAHTTILAYGGSRRVWGWPTSSNSRSLDAAGNPDAFEKKLAECSRKGPVIVDTPGLGPADDPTSLFEALENRPDIETHVVLPATAKAADLIAMVQRFESLSPARIAFTHLDESTRNGNLLTAASSVHLPVTFLSAGQNIDQLQIATVAGLVALVLGDGASVRAGDRPRRAARAS